MRTHSARSKRRQGNTNDIALLPKACKPFVGKLFAGTEQERQL
jgi:hypothetical protein